LWPRQLDSQSCARDPVRRMVWWDRMRRLLSEISVRFFQINRLDPNIPITHVVSFALQLQPARRIRNSFAAIVPSVNAGVRPTPNLADLHIAMNFLAVELHRHPRLLHHLAALKTPRAQTN